MTEAEWLTATDPTPMLGFISGKASDRKLQLFAVSLIGAHHERFPEALLTLALAAELRADGLLLPERQGDVERRVNEWVDQMHAEYGSGSRGWPETAKYAIIAAGLTYALPQIWLRQTDLLVYRLGSRITQLSQPNLLREIFGNPFRPVAADPAWLTSDVVALAHGIYDNKAFDRMPILADALQDAGCDSDDILNHCRGDGPHVRGCWVVDLVLGKE